MAALRTRREHWKPTLEAVQRFGDHASKNVVELSREEAGTFVAGEDQELEWDGDWGYLIVTHELAGEAEPLGVALYVHGELRSQVPKGRRRDFR
jgi:NOL1/NOP2/fmu family ribosome biogenesis protein